MKLNFENRLFCRKLRHLVAALLVAFLVVLTLINPWAAHGPGIAHEVGKSRETISSLAEESPVGGVCFMEVDTALPYLRCGTPADHFQALRQRVIDGAGFDFLSKCGDMMRDKNARPMKEGVVFRSRHKSGEAFDFNQEDPNVLLVRESKDGRTYWRTYLKCQKQDGSLGTKVSLETENAGLVMAYVFDFTAAAESLGWERIPARHGWSNEPSTMEFWHYQMREGLSFDQAIETIYE